MQPLGPYFRKNHDKASKAHSHSYYQILLFKEAGRHFVDYEVVDHAPNTVFVLYPGQIHYFCSHAVNDGTIIQFNEQFLLRFDPHSVDAIEYALFNDIAPQSFVLDTQKLSQVQNIIDLIETELATHELKYPRQSYHLVRTLLTYLERAQKGQKQNVPQNDIDFEVALKFKRLVKTHMNSFPSLEEYSNWLLISTKTLTRISKQYLKDTPANVIRKRKILEAKRLLANKKMSVKEVGYALGFEEPSNFTKYFFRVEGIKPKAFQQQLP